MEEKSPKPQIRSLISEGQDLYNRYHKAKNDFESSQVFGSIMRDVGSNWLSSALGIPKKYTRALKGSTKNPWEMSEQYQQLANEYNTWVDKSKEVVVSISEWNQNLRYPGNSQKLLNKFNRLDSKVRLDTKIRNGVAILTDIHSRKLVYNSDLPKKKIRRRKVKPVKPKVEKTPSIEELIQQGSAILFKLETNMRSFIEKTLSEYYGKKWWKAGIPKDVRQNCELRMNKNESPFGLPKSTRKLDYADFSGYRKVILRKDNWKKIYYEYFGNHKSTIESYLNQLEEIRNTIQHNRSNISDKAILKLQLFSDDILNAIRQRVQE